VAQYIGNEKEVPREALVFNSRPMPNRHDPIISQLIDGYCRQQIGVATSDLLGCAATRSRLVLILQIGADR
jgi:hypothetical protein